MTTWTFPRADVVRVIDADTVELDVISDIGFGDSISRRRSFRLYGINTRELDEPGGLEAFEYVKSLLPVGMRLTLRSVKVDKYGGRYDATLLDDQGRDLSSVLITGQWAAPWNGRGPKPVPPWPRTLT